jgi:RecB family exonuclease
MNCGNCFTPIRKNDTSIKCLGCNIDLHPACATNNYCDVCVLEGKSDTTLMEMPLPDSIRRSHIELYRKCPYSFYLEVIKGQTKPDTIYTKLGIDLHDLFDEHANQDVKMEKLEMMERYGRLFSEYTPELFGDVDRDKMWARAMTSISKFYDVAENLPYRPFATEEKIEFSVGEGVPKVNLTMDRIDEVAGELEILDWKTGKVIVGKNLCYDLQAPLYIHGVRTHYKRPVRRFTFQYVNEGKNRVFERVNDDVYRCTVGKKEYDISITEKLREVNTLFSRIKRGDFNVPTDTRGMFFTCKMCHQKAIGSCAGVEEQSWHNAREAKALW